MKKVFLTTVTIILLLSISVFSQNESEKASLIIDFIDNMEWTSNGPNGDAVVVGIIGESTLTASLQEKISTSKSKITVKSKSITDDISDCNVIYTPSKELKDLAKVLKKLNKTNIVSIGNAKDFARYGIMINLVEDGSKIKYEVNKMVLESIGVKLSSKIMKNAIKI